MEYAAALDKRHLRDGTEFPQDNPSSGMHLLITSTGARWNTAGEPRLPMKRARPGSHNCMRIPLLPEAGARRAYGFVTLVNTFGFGLIVTSMVLYFTRVLHLSSNEVGLGMTIAGLIGLIAGVPIGDLADRYGPRVVVRATFLVSFLTTVGLGALPSARGRSSAGGAAAAGALTAGRTAVAGRPSGGLDA